MKMTLKDKLEQAAAKEAAPVAKEEPAQTPPKGGTTNGAKDHRPTLTSVQVIKAARNKHYVYASLDGERVSVLCRGRDRDRIIGKRINVLVSEFDGVKSYEHQP